MAQTTQDFVKRIDLTALTDVTGSEMNQLIDAATVATDKGLRIIRTDTALNVPDVPNPDVELEGITPTHWKRYKWVRLPFAGSGGAVKEYNWNEEVANDAIYLKWIITVDIESLQDEIDEANENAANAVTTADTASAAATTALNTANTANTNAIDAQATANTANATANALTTTVSNLSSSVALLQTDAGIVTQNILALQTKTARVPIGSFYLREQANAGVNGQNTQAGLWVKRLFTDIRCDNENIAAGYVTLNADSTITISVAGKWIIESSHVCYANGAFHKTRWVDSDGNVYQYGTAEYGAAYGGTPADQSNSKIQDYFEIGAETIFRIDHICGNTVINGFGHATNLGGPEIYGLLKLTYLGA
jgi:hypothetical protein